jgi:hypothetical protein
VNTLKSAALIVVLIAVLYGVYVALNKPDPLGPAQLPGSPEAPLIEFAASPTGSYPPPPTVSLPGEVESPAAGAPARTVRGGAFQPEADPATLLPPASPPPLAPPDPGAPTAAPPDLAPPVSPASSLQRSAYEAPADPTSSTSATELTPADPIRPPVSAESGPTAAAAAPPATSPSLAAYALQRDLHAADRLVGDGKFRAALALLTPHYFEPALSAPDRAALVGWLDALAGKVIYSRDHLLAMPHQVRKGETLFDIARQYNVEYRLLQNINTEIREPDVLVAGTQLKVVPGPFRADVNLATSEITLLVGDMYAGRFPFSLGDQPPAPGDHKVIDKKSQQKTYVGFDGRIIPANDPSNPYGEYWISLGGETCIHGSPVVPASRPLGCISLSPQDAKDVYGILSIGSEVRIRR